MTSPRRGRAMSATTGHLRLRAVPPLDDDAESAPDAGSSAESVEAGQAGPVEAGRSGRTDQGDGATAATVRRAPQLAGPVGDGLGDGLEDAVAAQLVVAGAGLIDAPASVALLVGDRLVRRATSGGGPGLRIGAQVPMDGTACAVAAETGRAIRTSGSAERGPSSSCCGGARSHLAVPLATGDQVVGVLSFIGEHPDWFDGTDEVNALALAGVAAASIVAFRAAGHPAPWGPSGPAREAADRADRTSGRDDAVAGAAADGPGWWSWDGATGSTRWSPSVPALLGTTAGGPIDLDLLRALTHPEDLPRLEAMVTARLAGATGGPETFRITTPSGIERHLELWAAVHRRGDLVGGATVALVDVTARARQALALRSSQAGLRAAQELTGLAIWEWNPADGRVHWSPEMYRIAGVDPDEIRPSLALWHSVIHPDDLDRARRLDVGAVSAADAPPAPVRTARGTGRRVIPKLFTIGLFGPSSGGPAAPGPESQTLVGEDGEPGGRVETFRVIGRDGVRRHVQSWSTVIPRDGLSGRTVSGATIDVTRQVGDRVLLERRSATDPVTGLANRLGFDRRVQELLADHSRDVSLLLLDLDRFKLVNDSLGHQVGDRLLVEVARRLQAVVPAHSVTARMGGDEFVVVPPAGLGWRELRVLAGEVVDALRVPFDLNGSGEVLVCPASVGVTSTSGRRVTVDELLSEADLALYRAKDSGRDRYVVFDDALRQRAHGRHRAEQLLRSALETDRLVVEYQPIVDFLHGRVVGAEALVRMRAEDGVTLLGPDTFVDVAEDTGLVVDLDCWVIQEALRQLAQWWRNAPPSQVPWLAVNVSPRSMEHPRLVRTLLDGLRSRGLPHHLLKVELTEHSFLSTLPGGEASLRQLITSGIPVGIDDFGTGYSALAYLPRFELDFMKIDRAFVAPVGQDAQADAVVDAIVALAHAHGMKVTAEGIETPKQARRLREMGCDFAQGFHFGRPGDASRILRG